MVLISDPLLALLACPECLGRVEPGPHADAPRWLCCCACKRYYPFVDGIPVMIRDRATLLPPE